MNVLSDFKSIFGKSKFTTDTLWLIFSQGILIGSGLFVNLIIGYQFGAFSLGVFNQILGFYLILSTFFSLGLNNSIIHKISISKSIIHRQIFSSNFLITSWITLLLTFLGLTIIHYYPSIFSSPELAQGLSITVLSLPFFNWNKNFMAYCTGVRKQKLFSNIRSIRWLIIVSVISGVSIFSENDQWLYYSFLISEFGIFIFLVLRFNSLFTLKISLNEIKANFSFGLKSFMAEVFSILNDKLDLIILGYMLSGTEVGIYSFFIFFAKSLYIFPGILQQNINPIIGRHWIEHRMDELKRILGKIRKVNLMVIVIQAIFILVFYKVLTDFYKPEFQNTLGYLAFVIAGIIPASLIGWGGSILVMTGKLNENILRTFYILILSVLNILTLTYLFGFNGACIAVVLNSIITFMLLFGFVKKLVGIRLI